MESPSDHPAYLEGLNPAQEDAVLHDGASLLILAGAGSGKTRVITSKIAWYIDSQGIDPASILALTFTNKAAREMKERVCAWIGDEIPVMVRTFHSFGAWLLRRHASVIGLNPAFTVYDDEDSRKLIKSLFPELSAQMASRYASVISRAKDYALSPSDSLAAVSRDPELPRIYQAYQDRLDQMGNADFGDLIVKPRRMIQEHPEIASRLRQRFTHILVDEYQDSNVAQFLFLKAFWAPGTRITVVGDDDQSIYKFRGAEIGNILNFPKEFPETKIVKLEQNYRSTQAILGAAGEVVAMNTGRMGKTLWTKNEKGKNPSVHLFPTTEEEVDFCARMCLRPYDGKTAIIYRTNAQSRGFETAFARLGIVYNLVGSLAFYEREEVKDILAWLKLTVNPMDEISFLRIANKPARGLGDKTLNALVARSRQEGLSFLEICKTASDLSKRALEGCAKVVHILEKARSYEKNGGLDVCVAEVISASALGGYYKDTDEKEGRTKAENLEELISAAVDYPGTEEGLCTFLEHVELDREIIRGRVSGIGADVFLMTLHNTKGLEFDRVIITGMEDGLFPRFGMENDEMEEERRLFYVGMTRARKELYFTSVQYRRLRGQTEMMKISPFLKELPGEWVDKAEISGPMGQEFKAGDYIKHPEYGLGVITKTSINGNHQVIDVNFQSGKTGRFLPKYDKITKVAEVFFDD